MGAGSALFRAEALAAQDGALQGATACTLGPGPRMFTLLAACAALAVLAFAGWGRYTRSEHVAGTLQPSRGLVKVRTPQAGIVVERRVHEGQRVRRGDVLLVLSSDRPGDGAAGAQAAVLDQLDRRSEGLAREREAQARIDALALQTLLARRRGLQADLDQAAAELALQRQRVTLAAANAARHRELVERQFETAAALQPHLDAELEARTRLLQAERAHAALQRELQATEFDADSARLRQANNASSLDRQRAELAQQRTEADLRRGVLVTAPADGQVTALTVDVGHAADPAADLMLLLPQGAELQAQLWLPSRAIGFVRPGQAVRLRYQAFPYQHFGQHEGRVLEVSRAPVAVQGDAGPPMYRVTVQLPAQQLQAQGRPLALAAGMALDADIRLDTRRLIDWLLDPLGAARPGA